MLIRLRSSFLASGGALLLVLSLSGLVAAASILQVVTAPVADPTAGTDTTATFEDLDGNGVDDDCQTDVVENADAAAAAEKAADLNGDGQISVSEAAQSGRTGGKNCNHGGYVSGVAHCATTQTTEATETSDETDATETTETSDETDATETSDESVTTTETTTSEITTSDTTSSDSATCADETTDATDTTVPAVCAPIVAPAVDASTTFDTEPVALVRDVAQDKTAVGGKNCNHGGAVSEAAHAANAARSAARDAAKVERDAARAARASERAAAHAAKIHGKGHKH
jgi:hypothetical protein